MSVYDPRRSQTTPGQGGLPTGTGGDQGPYRSTAQQRRGQASGSAAVNQQLWQLWLQTGDPTIFEYIQSGWTTPVSPAVQQAVSQIVGRDVPSTQPGLGAQATPAPEAENLNLPGVRSSAPAAPSAAPPPGPVGAGPGLAAGLGEQLTGTPPSAVPAGGGPAVTPAGLGEQLTGNGPGNPPATPYQQGNEDFWNRLLANPPSSTPPANKEPTPPPTPPITPSSGGTNPGGGSVNPVDPNSYVGQAGYRAAMEGDQTMQNAVLGKLLGNLGVDVTRPGFYTDDIVSTIMPYMQTFLRYFGLDNGMPALDRAREAANQFGSMLGSAGTFGQLQKYGQSLVPGVQNFMQASGIKPSQQMGIASDLLGLLTAGNNAISQAADRGNLMAGQQRAAQAGLEDPNLNYLDFIRQQTANAPVPGAYGALLQMLAGK